MIVLHGICRAYHFFPFINKHKQLYNSLPFTVTAFDMTFSIVLRSHQQVITNHVDTESQIVFENEFRVLIAMDF